jgi:hypothetical protein
MRSMHGMLRAFSHANLFVAAFRCDVMLKRGMLM